MTHLTDVIEEQKKSLRLTFEGNGAFPKRIADPILVDKLEDFLEEGMYKSALAVLDELEWKGKGFNSGSEVVTWSDKKREEIRTQLLDNK